MGRWINKRMPAVKFTNILIKGKAGICVNNSTIGLVDFKDNLFGETEVPHIHAYVDKLSVRPSSDIRDYDA